MASKPPRKKKDKDIYMDQAFEVYRYYLALRLHFTTDQYDVIAQRGKVKASKQAFLKRKDLLAIRKVAESYSDQEVVNFLVANFVSGDRWGGVFDIEAKDRYTHWKKRLESLTYTFEQELDQLIFSLEQTKISWNDAFNSTSGHPLILKMYLRQKLSMETLVILNKLYPFIDSLDKQLADDLIWPDISRIIKKYTPFLTYNHDRVYASYRRKLRFN